MLPSNGTMPLVAVPTVSCHLTVQRNWRSSMHPLEGTGGRSEYLDNCTVPYSG